MLSSAVSAISNPAFRKVVAQTRKSYMGHSNPQQIIRPPPQIGSERRLAGDGQPHSPLVRQTAQIAANLPVQYNPARINNLFMPKSRP
jgi:hypothetical protein